MEALDDAFENCPAEFEDFLVDQDAVTPLNTPCRFPEKVKSINSTPP